MCKLYSCKNGGGRRSGGRAPLLLCSTAETRLQVKPNRKANFRFKWDCVCVCLVAMNCPTSAAPTAPAPFVRTASQESIEEGDWVADSAPTKTAVEP